MGKHDDEKTIGTALAVMDAKLGSGMATKYNAARLTTAGLKWQTEKVYVRQIMERSAFLASVFLRNPVSLLVALQSAAALGLSLDPNLGLAYLVPQRPRNDADFEVILKVSYRGMEQAVLASGTVTAIQTELFYENDDFDYGVNIDGPFLTFKMARGDRGALQGGFCLARYANGERHVEVMSAKELADVEAAAIQFGNGKAPAWKGVFKPEMQKKSIVRRAQKHWPKSPVLAKLAQVFDVENPVDFEHPVLTGEVVEVMGDTEVAKLEQLLAPLDNPELVAEWLHRMAEALDYDAIRDVPRDRFDEVYERLKVRLDIWQEARNPPPPEETTTTEEHPE